MKNTLHAMTLLMLIQALSGCGRTDQDTSPPWAIDGPDAKMSVSQDQGEPDMGPQVERSCERPIMLIAEQPSQPVPWPRTKEPSCNGDLVEQVHYAVEVPAGHRLTMYGDGVGIRQSCGQSCLVTEYALINRGDEPMIVQAAAQRWSEEDDSAQVMARLTPLASNSICTMARVIAPGDILRAQDALSGEAFANVCEIVQSGHTLFYQISLRLGVSPSKVRIKATPDDASNLSISLQALLSPGTDEPCSTQCSGADDAYFRSAAEAVLDVGVDAGGGRDPVDLLIAVTMAPSDRPEAASTFTLSVEALD